MNGPSSTVVSGENGALEELTAECERRGIRARPIVMGYASHSVWMEELRERVLTDLAGLSPAGDGTVTMFSTLTGRLLESRLDAQYWYDNLRSPVEFEDTVRNLLEQGMRTFIEVSPHPVLTVGVQETLDAADVQAAVLGTLRRGEGGPRRLLASLGEAWKAGVDVDWPAVLTGRRTPLPTYAFQRERYWPEPPVTAMRRCGGRRVLGRRGARGSGGAARTRIRAARPVRVAAAAGSSVRCSTRGGTGSCGSRSPICPSPRAPPVPGFSSRGRTTRGPGSPPPWPTPVRPCCACPSTGRT